MRKRARAGVNRRCSGREICRDETVARRAHFMRSFHAASASAIGWRLAERDALTISLATSSQREARNDGCADDRRTAPSGTATRRLGRQWSLNADPGAVLGRPVWADQYRGCNPGKEVGVCQDRRGRIMKCQGTTTPSRKKYINGVRPWRGTGSKHAKIYT